MAFVGEVQGVLEVAQADWIDVSPLLVKARECRHCCLAPVPLVSEHLKICSRKRAVN